MTTTNSVDKITQAMMWNACRGMMNGKKFRLDKDFRGDVLADNTVRAKDNGQWWIITAVYSDYTMDIECPATEANWLRVPLTSLEGI